MDWFKINFNSFGTRIISLYFLYNAEHSYSSSHKISPELDISFSFWRLFSYVADACGRFFAGIVGSNPAGGMKFVSCERCVLSLRRADHSPVRVLQTVVCLSMNSR